MAHCTPGFMPAPGDELTARTLPVFFGVLELLLCAGVTTIADAAFQDHVWRPRLEPLRGLARLRIVYCLVTAEVAFHRHRLAPHQLTPLGAMLARSFPQSAVAITGPGQVRFRPFHRRKRTTCRCSMFRSARTRYQHLARLQTGHVWLALDDDMVATALRESR